MAAWSEFQTSLLGIGLGSEVSGNVQLVDMITQAARNTVSWRMPALPQPIKFPLKDAIGDSDHRNNKRVESKNV